MVTVSNAKPEKLTLISGGEAEQCQCCPSLTVHSPADPLLRQRQGAPTRFAIDATSRSKYLIIGLVHQCYNQSYGISTLFCTVSQSTVPWISP